MSEYEDYIKDQREDTMFEPQHREMGKSWIYKYCDFFFKDATVDLSKAKVLDVGCREFFTYDYFLEKYNNKITGLDICNVALDYVYQNDKEVLDLDAHKMLDVLDSNSFDYVFSCHSLEHMIDIKKVVENCYTVLKEGGKFYFAVPVPCKNEKRGHWADIPNESFMIKLCEDIGFKKVFSQLFDAGNFRDEQEMVAIFEK